jgi:hypothetical protein
MGETILSHDSKHFQNRFLLVDLSYDILNIAEYNAVSKQRMTKISEFTMSRSNKL